MKRTRVLVMCLVVLSLCTLGLFAQGTKESVSESSLPKVTWKISHTVNPGSVMDKTGEKFKEYVEAASDGNFKVEVFHSGVLGWEREVLEAHQMGTIVASLPNVSVLAEFVPAYDVFNLPFLFQSPEHMIKTYSHPVMEKLAEASEEAGFVIGAQFDATFRYPVYNRRPIKTVADFKGLKFRTMGVPAHIEAYSALGANVVSMAFSEVYSAMQLGTVDGCENNYDPIYSMRFDEVADYISNLPIVASSHAIIFSKKAFDKLPEAYQKIAMDGAKVAADYGNEIGIAAEEAALQAMIDKGVIPVMVDDFTPFMAVTEPVSQKYLKGMEPWVQELREVIISLAE